MLIIPSLTVPRRKNLATANLRLLRGFLNKNGCGYIFFLFDLIWNHSHVLLRRYLVVRPEAKRLVEIIRDIGSGVCWDVTFSGNCHHIHGPDRSNQLRAGIFFFQFLLRISVDNKCREASCEVGRNSVFPVFPENVDRTFFNCFATGIVLL